MCFFTLCACCGGGLFAALMFGSHVYGMVILNMTTNEGMNKHRASVAISGHHERPPPPPRPPPASMVSYLCVHACVHASCGGRTPSVRRLCGRDISRALKSVRDATGLHCRL